MEALFRVPLKVTTPFADPPLFEPKVVSAPKVTLLPKVCTPEVVIAPPLRDVVPVAAFCTTDAVVTTAENVVVPVELSDRAPNLPLVPPPTAPVKVMLPEPEVMVMPLLAEAALPTLAALLRVLAKEKAPFEDELVEFNVTSATKVIAEP